MTKSSVTATKSNPSATKKKSKCISNATRKESKSTSDAKENESKIIPKEPSKTKFPPEDAWTQTEDLPADPADVRSTAGTQTAARTQDQSVTSSDQTANKGECVTSVERE